MTINTSLNTTLTCSATVSMSVHESRPRWLPNGTRLINFMIVVASKSKEPEAISHLSDQPSRLTSPPAADRYPCMWAAAGSTGGWPGTGPSTVLPWRSLCCRRNAPRRCSWSRRRRCGRRWGCRDGRTWRLSRRRRRRGWRRCHTQEWSTERQQGERKLNRYNQ